MQLLLLSARIINGAFASAKIFFSGGQKNGQILFFGESVTLQKYDAVCTHS